MLHIEKNPGILFEINALTNSARILLTRILSLVLLDHLTPIINPVGKRIEFVMSDLKNSAILLELFQNDEKKLLQWLEHIRTSLAVDMLVGKDVPTSLFNDRTIEKLSMSLIPINEVSTEKPSLGFDVMMAGRMTWKPCSSTSLPPSSDKIIRRSPNPARDWKTTQPTKRLSDRSWRSCGLMA